MPVGVMLNSMTSEELARWAAYEKVSGPLGEQYSDSTLANIFDGQQLTNYLLGAIYASWTEGTNPIPKPEQLTRPHQIFADPPAKPEADTEDDSEEQKVPPGYVSWQALAAQIELDQGKK